MATGEVVYKNYNGGKPFENFDYKEVLNDNEYAKLLMNPSYNSKTGGIVVRDKDNLTIDEYNALLLIHSANIDRYSFAAEIKFHAESILKPVGDRAIKSDMGVGESKNYGRFVPFN